MFNNSNNRITVYKQKVVHLISVIGNLRFSRQLSNTILNKKKSLIFFNYIVRVDYYFRYE